MKIKKTPTPVDLSELNFWEESPRTELKKRYDKLEEKFKKLKTETDEYWEALHPYASGGAYSNFMMDEGLDRVKASYKHNYERLAKIKNKYDPANFFRVNQNIIPSK